ncbi:hypothetical protein [Parahaliea mediterranea]|uniref:2TM domain-containing protein n=1 Tax=Parahaliea mediterranea TaxID=651086 RepID=A0A939DFQ4_9GAMM|nr:hypothetical protein [Parahaliea mediterranea]MBN7797214.1 hypothetical protein [Parahaliea mediterranea]
MAGEKRYLFDNPRNVRRILWALYAACILTLSLELVVHRHTEHPWEWLPGFYPAYGFIGCVVLVLVAKWMRKIIIRPEDYYQQRDLPPWPDNGAARRGEDSQ